jgi:hypothetical protein
MRKKLFELRSCLWFFIHSVIRILFNKSQPDKKALAWHEKNKWFGKQKLKTKDTLALHAVLVEAGVNPKGPKYYRLIDMFFEYKK